MLALCARYQFRAVGLSTKAIQRSIAGDEVARLAARPGDRLTAVPQQPLVHRPPPSAARRLGADGLSTPRPACQRMKDIAARRNGR